MLIGPGPILLAAVCLWTLISIRAGRQKLDKHTIGCVAGIGQLAVIIFVLALGYTSSKDLSANFILVSAIGLLVFSIALGWIAFPDLEYVRSCGDHLASLNWFRLLVLAIVFLGLSIAFYYFLEATESRLENPKCERYRCRGAEIFFGRKSGPVLGLWLASAIFLFLFTPLMMGFWGLYLKARQGLQK